MIGNAPVCQRVFECSDFGAPTNGSSQPTSWVVVDPDLECFGHEHAAWMAVAGVLVVLYGVVSIELFLSPDVKGPNSFTSLLLGFAKQVLTCQSPVDHLKP